MTQWVYLRKKEQIQLYLVWITDPTQVHYPNEINSMHQEFHTYIFYLEVSLLVEIYYTISCNIKTRKKNFLLAHFKPRFGAVQNQGRIIFFANSTMVAEKLACNRSKSYMVVLIKDQGKRSFSNRSMVVKNDTFDRYVYIYCMYYIGRLVVFYSIHYIAQWAKRNPKCGR